LNFQGIRFLILISIIVLPIAVVVDMLIPVPFAGLSVEIVGTLIGFLLALRASEALDREERRKKKDALFDSLIGELEEFLNTFAAHRAADHDAYIPLPTDNWDIAKNSGEASLLEPEVRTKFIVFYNMARYYNMTFEAYLSKDNKSTDEARKEASEHQAVLDHCILIAKSILSEYKPEGIPEVLREKILLG